PDHLAVRGPLGDRAARGRRGDRRLPGAQPVPVAAVDLAPLALVAQLDGPEGDIAVHQDHRPGRDVQLGLPGRGWSPPRSWSTACTSNRSRTASPSRTPPV